MPQHYGVPIPAASSQRNFNACREAESTRNESPPAIARTMPRIAGFARSMPEPFAAISRVREPRTPWTTVHVPGSPRSTAVARRLKFAFVLLGVERCARQPRGTFFAPNRGENAGNRDAHHTHHGYHEEQEPPGQP